ncbi:MAG: hypothetical protein Q8M16_22200, partial [Pirellulaceae bacterium]|nr:hypothetical protein [Pirellulaceae bacterium]
LTLDSPDPEYLKVANALDMEADAAATGRHPSPQLQHLWAEIGDLVMNPKSRLFQDLIADIEVDPIPLDPRLIERYI